MPDEDVQAEQEGDVVVEDAPDAEPLPAPPEGEPAADGPEVPEAPKRTVVQRGDEGVDVRAAQVAFGVNVSGVFDERFERFVKNYQLANGEEATGVLELSSVPGAVPPA